MAILFLRYFALVGNLSLKYWALVGNPSLKSITLVGYPIFEIFCSSWQSFFETFSSSWQSFCEICSSSWQSFPKPWAIIILSTLLWSLILFSYSLRISKNVSVKKVLEFHSVAYEIQPMFTRSSISFCLLSRIIKLGKVNKSNGGPCTLKFLVLKCVKKYFNWELLLRHGNLLNIKAYKY